MVQQPPSLNPLQLAANTTALGNSKLFDEGLPIGLMLSSRNTTAFLVQQYCQTRNVALDSGLSSTQAVSISPHGERKQMTRSIRLSALVDHPAPHHLHDNSPAPDFKLTTQTQRSCLGNSYCIKEWPGMSYRCYRLDHRVIYNVTSDRSCAAR